MSLDRGPKPNVRQMLEVAHACGLTTIEEAYHNYINHYDMFFYIPAMAQQSREFARDLAIAGLMEEIVNKDGDEVGVIIEAKIEDYL